MFLPEISINGCYFSREQWNRCYMWSVQQYYVLRMQMDALQWGGNGEFWREEMKVRGDGKGYKHSFKKTVAFLHHLFWCQSAESSAWIMGNFFSTFNINFLEVFSVSKEIPSNYALSICIHLSILFYDQWKFSDLQNEGAILHAMRMKKKNKLILLEIFIAMKIIQSSFA